MFKYSLFFFPWAVMYHKIPFAYVDKPLARTPFIIRSMIYRIQIIYITIETFEDNFESKRLHRQTNKPDA